MTSCIAHPDTDPEDTPDATIGYLCDRHYSRLRSALLELPAIATWLEVNIAAGGVPGERVAGSREDPIPLRLDVLDIIGPVAPNPTRAIIEDPDHQLGDPGMYDEMRSWAAFVQEETGFTWEDRYTLTGTVTYLAGHLSWVAGQEWVDEFAAKIRDLAVRAHRLAPWRPETHRDHDPCATCGVRAVVWHVADGVMRCEKRMGGCGRTVHMTKREMDIALPRTRRAG